MERSFLLPGIKRSFTLLPLLASMANVLREASKINSRERYCSRNCHNKAVKRVLEKQREREKFKLPFSVRYDVFVLERKKRGREELWRELFHIFLIFIFIS